MNPKIEKTSEIIYKTTDGQVFTGEGKEDRAEVWQKHLDHQMRLDKFSAFLRKLFNLPTKEDSDEDWSEHNEIMSFLAKLTSVTDICCRSSYPFDEYFDKEFAQVLLRLYGFIGPEKWTQISQYFNEECKTV